MTARANAVFKIKKWDEKPYHEGPGRIAFLRRLLGKENGAGEAVADSPAFAAPLTEAWSFSHNHPPGRNQGHYALHSH